MFLQEADFDEDELSPQTNKLSANSNVPLQPLGYSSSPNPKGSGMSNLNVLDLDDNNEGTFGSAGGISTPNSSRARMLAQQREIQLKKRQSLIENGGMIRSSLDKNDDNDNDDGSKGISSNISQLRKSQAAQYTPAVRQFSAPKAVKESSTDFVHSTEFDKPQISKASARPFQGRTNTNETNENNNAGASSWRDYDQDDFDDYRSNNRDRNNGRNKSNSGRDTRRYDDDDDDRDFDRNYEDRRRGSRRDDRNSRSSWDRGLRDRDERYERRRDDRDRERDRRRDDRDRDRRRSRYDDEEDDDEDDDDERREYEREKKREKEKEREQKNREKERREARKQAKDKANNNTEKAAKAQAEAETPAAPPPQPLDLSDMRKFLTNPVPRECGVVQCCIKRDKSGTNMMFPKYTLFLDKGDRFLMTSRKRPHNRLSNYLISMSEHDLSREGPCYLGKLRKSNMYGTEFVVYDDGCNPKDASEGGDNNKPRTELAACTYAPNVIGSRGPRKMQVAIPQLDENYGNSNKTAIGESLDLLNKLKEKEFRNVTYMINNPPRWNANVSAYVLNFQGRVTMASVKNFQLVNPDDQDSILLQFGRTAKDYFTMDLQWPLSPLQAFAITLSSFDSKIACD